MATTEGVVEDEREGRRCGVTAKGAAGKVQKKVKREITVTRN